MKTVTKMLTTVAVLACLAGADSASAQGTSFSYQGRLDEGGNPAQGTYDLRFSIFDAADGGSQVGTALTNSATSVTKGLFTASLDFGSGVFTGGARWLEIGVRTNGGGTFTVLSSRQKVAATPYALTSSLLTGTLSAAQLTGALPPASLAGTYSGAVTLNNAANNLSGSGAGLTALNASQLTLGTVPNARLSANVTLLGQTIESSEIADGTIAAVDVNAASFNTTFWRVNGNAGTTAGTHFLGTTDAQALELKVNGGRALRLEPSTFGPNVMGGAANNSASGGAATVSGGENNIIQTNANYAAISGGQGNQIQALPNGNAAKWSFIGGGQNNVIEPFSYNASIVGGIGNKIQFDGDTACIGGGSANLIGTNADAAVIGGGLQNSLGEASRYSVIGGGWANSLGVMYDRTYPAGSLGSTIGGGISNTVAGGGIWGGEIPYRASQNATISGGVRNSIVASTNATIGGGRDNSVSSGNYGTIGGGISNAVSAYGTVSGGIGNYASDGATVGGGGFDGNSAYPNRAYGNGSVIGGGTQNLASDSRSTVAGGHNNSATNYYATVPGGAWNVAGGQGSFAAGRAAKAIHHGAFVWSDDANADLLSTVANSVTMRASGGYRLFSSTAAGVSLAAGSGSWTSMSDRNAKENFESIDAQAVLEKVAALPLSTWNYKSQDSAIRHVGPMAQDFKTAFSVGETETGISTIDADGVALAAIQGLNQKVEEQRAELKAKDKELKELWKIVTELKAAVLPAAGK